MMRLCINCDTENPLDAVMCLQCGMSLTRAPTVEPRQGMKHTRPVVLAAEPAPGLWMRGIARSLALLWAGFWTVLLSPVAFFAVATCSRVSAFNVVARPLWQCVWELCAVFPVALLLWAPAAIARRSEAIAGILLAVEGLVGFGLVAWGAWAELQNMLRWGEPLPGLLPLILFFGTFALPLAPSVAGSLFLASWWKSRTPAPPEATE